MLALFSKISHNFSIPIACYLPGLQSLFIISLEKSDQVSNRFARKTFGQIWNCANVKKICQKMEDPDSSSFLHIFSLLQTETNALRCKLAEDLLLLFLLYWQYLVCSKSAPNELKYLVCSKWTEMDANRTGISFRLQLSPMLLLPPSQSWHSVSFQICFLSNMYPNMYQSRIRKYVYLYMCICKYV